MFFFNSTPKKVDDLIKRLHSKPVEDCFDVMTVADEDLIKKLIDKNDITSLDRILDVAPDLLTSNKEFMLIFNLSLIGHNIFASMMQYAALNEQTDIIKKFAEYYEPSQLKDLFNPKSDIYSKVYEMKKMDGLTETEITSIVNKTIEKLSELKNSTDNRNSSSNNR